MSEDIPLSQNIVEYHKAIESEYALTAHGSKEDLADQARIKLFGLLSDASNALQSVLLNADSDAARLTAVKLVFGYTIGVPGASQGTEDEMQRLINTLIKSPAAH